MVEPTTAKQLVDTWNEYTRTYEESLLSDLCFYYDYLPEEEEQKVENLEEIGSTVMEFFWMCCRKYDKWDWSPSRGYFLKK